MNAEELRSKLKDIFGSQIVFNKDFDYFAETLNNLDVNVIEWCQQVKNQEIKATFPEKFREGMVFIKKIGSSNRCLVMKIKNGEFKEVHLGDHDYYNKLTKALGLKKSSETY